LGILNKAMNLAFAELLGNADLVNSEIKRIQAVSASGIQTASSAILNETNCSTLYYLQQK